jgi:uncharacterized coiled-coil protein SlyX
MKTYRDRLREMSIEALKDKISRQRKDVCLSQQYLEVMLEVLKEMEG